MKIETTKDRLADALQKAEKVTAKNANLPVLKCVLLEASKGSLFVRSTNLDIGLEISVPVKIEEEGIVAVPGNILSSYISQLPVDKSIQIEHKVIGGLKVSTTKNSTSIKTFSPEEYPPIPKVDTDTSKSFKIEARAFVSGLKAVWYSSANSNIKPELSSVRVYPDGNNLVFVATDGFRLAEKKVKIDQMPDFTHILIPVRNASEIIRIFDGVDETVEVFIDDNQIAIKSGSIYLVSRTIEGNFPDYKAIIPKEFVSTVVVLKQDLSNAFKINTLFSDSFYHISFSIDPKEKKFTLSTKNNEVGESSTDVPSTLEGESLQINFNYRYINDCLASMNTDSLSFEFSGSNRPLVIRPVQDTSFLYLVMPMNR
ncbi:MAG: DNA polymerase III subunit beta [Candidatus Taylorbacteria bacterium]|nr:DNA polymerase III subunit beta [Candidatus Taylorbacteria bacterium]